MKVTNDILKKSGGRLDLQVEKKLVIDRRHAFAVIYKEHVLRATYKVPKSLKAGGSADTDIFDSIKFQNRRFR